MEHFGDMEMGAGERSDLIDPGAVFPIIDLGEDGLLGEGAAPGADVPGTTLSRAAGFPRLVDLASGVENDAAGNAVDDSFLLESDDIGTGFAAGQNFRNVIGSDHVVVIDEGDVIAAGDIEESLALGADGAAFVIQKYQMFYRR